ncbi:sigma-70 family RNA polymerase sigma factor [Microvirga brassicacearum]|uniref:RNA polymerase sigma factor n=1 Tax=Microvirga brassicacearum TaxID=2580413 RepID=A0A5N3P911_9HYPH|nr:sigma-70 family RNA polymerase sigma factor [Microvirga brassicacearum]KAB0266208.1 sigma-70 family RNA polymerase sigma factor [Microvirga brassicacearum]
MTKSANASSGHATASLPAALDDHTLAWLGDRLRGTYRELVTDKLPHDLSGLLKRAFQVIRAQQEPIDQAFVAEMMSALSELRAYGVSLERDPVRAEDLVQETILRALSQHERYERGTCLRAWLFTILRNAFLTQIRRRGREVEDADGSYAERLTFAPDQNDKVTHRELLAALEALPKEHREVLVAVAVEGLSYEDAALKMNCAIGTIKSRVSRARRHLAERMGLTKDDMIGWTRV